MPEFAERGAADAEAGGEVEQTNTPSATSQAMIQGISGRTR